MRNYLEEWVDGQRVLPRLIDEDTTIDDEHRGGIVVLGGATLRLVGRHQGSLTLENGASATILGSHQGSVDVRSGAALTIEAHQQGSLNVAAGGSARIGPDGQSQGSVHVDGSLINEGARGGTVSGDGEIRDLPGSRVAKPVKRGNATYYEW